MPQYPRIGLNKYYNLEQISYQKDFYHKKWKETNDASYLTASLAYNNAVLLLLYAESEQDSMIDQFDYFTDEDYYKGLDN